MSQIKAVLFDVDGTLLDTTEFILQAYEHTLVKGNHLKTDFREQMKVLFGQPLLDCYQALAPDGDHEELCILHDNWQRDNLHLVTPFPTVVNAVAALQKKGLKIGAVTNRLRESTLTILENAKVHDSMEVVIGYEDVKVAKPHPEGIEKAIKLLHVKPEETIMVGDSEFDIIAGKAAGVVTVGIRTGLHPEAMEAAKPDHVIDRMEELLRLV